MNEQTAEITTPNAELEMQLLRQRAETMGLRIHHKASLETVRQKIQDHLEGKKASAEEDDEPKPETQQQIRDRVRGEALKLVRCKIYNLNPDKRDIPGEIITVANKYIGSVSKMIPFGDATENGYHIPHCIYENLLAKKFQSISYKKLPNGEQEAVRRLVPEYNVVVLPMLTEAELSELAVRQAAAERLGA